MSVIAFVGSTGAPGVTSTALALLLAWPVEPGRRLILAECDPDGGAVLAGALQGRMDSRYGLRNLAVASRKDQLVEAFWRQLVDLSEDESHTRLLLPGITDPAQAAGLDPAWGSLAELFARIEDHDHDVLVDLGRRGAFGASAVLARRADVVVLVVRNTLRGVQSAQVRAEALRKELAGPGGTGADSLAVIMVESGPYKPGEVEKVLHAPVLGAMPWRPQQAAVLSDGAEGGSRFARSDLMRAARSVIGPLRQRVLLRRDRLAPRPQGSHGHEEPTRAR
jgi:MinD-like ATPase involved in chromosome partitioning or flagellar assembly